VRNRLIMRTASFYLFLLAVFPRQAATKNVSTSRRISKNQ